MSNTKKIIAAAVLLGLVLFLIPMGIRFDKGLPEGDTRSVRGDKLLDLPESGHTLAVKMPDGTVQDVDLNTYLWSVVAAEMPAAFEQEALKAQAVAARTFALANTHKDNHPDADVCTDFACCQAWISRADAEANWGEEAIAKANRITTAVTDTADQVILYDGQPIQAAFHSSSGDTTQNAVEVWGYDAPYLVSVSSPEGDEVPDYHSQKSLTDEEFRDLVLATYPEANLGADPDQWAGAPVYNSGGTVATMTIGGVELSGSQVRTLFNLRSACFTLEHADGVFTFSVTGFGHGVGMSQYGANSMAQAGSTYPEILQHYYTGVTVEQCPDWVWDTLHAASGAETAEGAAEAETIGSGDYDT